MYYFIKNSFIILLLLIPLILLQSILISNIAWTKPLEGKFYVIGTGPSGPQLATTKALDCIKKADILLCSPSLQKRFSDYLKNKTILCNPWENLWEYKGKSWKEILNSDPEFIKEFQEQRIDRREKIVLKIKEEMKKGKIVALLDSGDPCLFGPSHWFIEGFDPKNVEIIPGVGAFSAAMAALKKSSIPAHNSRFVLQTAPSFLLNQEKQQDFMKYISHTQGTLVFYMALPKIERLIRKLQSNYPSDYPIAIVYYAGYSDKELVVKGTLNSILNKIKDVDENWLGMVIVGQCLEGTPYRSRVENITQNQLDN
jgi:precorrin-4 methylase